MRHLAIRGDACACESVSVLQMSRRNVFVGARPAQQAGSQAMLKAGMQQEVENDDGISSKLAISVAVLLTSATTFAATPGSQFDLSHWILPAANGADWHTNRDQQCKAGSWLCGRLFPARIRQFDRLLRARQWHTVQGLHSPTHRAKGNGSGRHDASSLGSFRQRKSRTGRRTESHCSAVESVYRANPHRLHPAR